MRRFFGASVLGVVICSAAILSASADDQKTEIKGGIPGKVKKVDADAKTLTITTDQGRERTFTVDDETTMVGPRGGKVRRGLKDPRFYEGMSVTIVAQGNTATEVHLGFQHKGDEEKAAARDSDKTKQAGSKETQEKVIRKATPARDAEAQPGVKTASRSRTTTPPADDDDDQEIPGKIKSFDSSRHILVITLLNGKDRSFLLPKDVKVLVKETASKHGLEDPALKVGASIEVVTDEGGHKVKELKVVPAVQRRKAG
jgi:hypothetical protein